MKSLESLTLESISFLNDKEKEDFEATRFAGRLQKT
jgi:hypothetical protein